MAHRTIERLPTTLLAAALVSGVSAWAIAQPGQPAGKAPPAATGPEKKEKAAAAMPADGWRSTFEVNKANLSSTGRSAYFVLEPGYKLSYAAKDGTLVISVLDETRVVDGVKTRVVEERETKNGELAEVSRNFFAIEPKSGDVYYFGEEVDIYKGGKVVEHEGAWLSGENGAQFGLMVSGAPKVGDKYYQERAPGTAMDRFEVVAIDEHTETPAGAFEKTLHVDETSALEAGHGHKWYAPGVGLVRDGEMKLTKIEPATAKK